MKGDEYGNNFKMFFIAYRNISTIDFGNFASVIFLLFLLVSYVLFLIIYLSWTYYIDNNLYNRRMIKLVF